MLGYEPLPGEALRPPALTATAPLEVESLGADLKRWLFEAALPLWSEVGRDRTRGGFFETLDGWGEPLEAPRRVRVVNRQIFSFVLAGQMGWDGPWREAVEAGLEVLLCRYLRPDGLFRVLVSPEGEAIDEEPAPYEQAFAMLALCAAHQVWSERGYEAMAVRTREALVERYGRPDGGFRGMSSAPLCANSHMHLFEAAQAWASMGLDPGWRRMAEALATLACQRMIDPRTGAMGEAFDEDWRALADTIVEPGHQFEWGWLLLRHGADAPALRLIDVGERLGVDPWRGVAINSLSAELAPHEASARLWPQTERLRAAVAAARVTGEGRYWTIAAKAGASLKRYLQTPTPGLWRDRMETSGRFVEEFAPASSLYHLIGAIRELNPSA